MIPIYSLICLSLVIQLSNISIAAAFSSIPPPPSDAVVASRGKDTAGKESETVDVAIVGAGPSGLTLAHCLIDRGYRVKVLERRSSFRPVGSAVFLHPFALASLENLSRTVYANVLEAATQVGTLTVKSVTNTKNRAIFDQFDRAPDVFGNPFVTIKFWDLLRSLRLGLPDDIFCFGSAVQGYEVNDDGRVKLLYSTEDEANPESMDARMVIDASGIRSQIRKQMLPESRSVPFSKAYMAVLPAEKADPIMVGKNDTMVSRELAFLIGDVDGMTLATLENGDVWWTYLCFDEDLESSSTQEELVEQVKGRYPPFVAELLRNTEERVEPVVADLPVSWKWGDGMVSLLGDSAHAQLPSLGMGCSTAFADIEEFCKQIDSEGLCERALRRYERWRMPQTAALQTASRFTYGGMRNIGKLK